MQTIKIEPFKVIGIAIRTTNVEGQSAQDMAQLWSRFFAEAIQEKIPNKTDNSLLTLYTNYEGDHMQPYDALIGCRVSSIDEIPEGMVAHSCEGGVYQKYLAKGDITQGVVAQTWFDIWSQKMERSYSTDFEEYGEKAQNPQDAEVDIYVAIKE